MKQPERSHWKLLRRLAVGVVLFFGGLIGSSVKGSGEISPLIVRTHLSDVGTFLVSVELWRAIGATTSICVGVAVTVIIVGLLLSLSIHLWPRAAIIETGIRFLRPIPAVGMLAVGILIFSSTSPLLAVFVAFVGGLWPFTVASLDALRNVPRVLEQSATTLGKNRQQYVKEVLLWAALPGILAAIRLVLPIVFLLTVTTQYLFHNLGGLGYLLADLQAGLEYPQLFVTVAVLGVIGWTFEVSVVELEWNILKWRRETPSEEA